MKQIPVSEKLSFLGCCIHFMHFLILLDPNGWHFWGFLFTSVLQNMIAASFAVILTLLVTSWVVIIDGGKAKVIPPWIAKWQMVSIAIFYTSELFMGIIEIVTNPDNKTYSGNYSGTINALKGIVFTINLLIWLGICKHYYGKISTQLSAGGASAAQLAPIKKMMRAIVVSIAIAVLYKAFFGFLRIGEPTLQYYPPCAAGSFSIVNTMFLVIQLACVVAQNPASGKKKGGKGSVSPTTTTNASSTS
jgi:hypothetical protein